MRILDKLQNGGEKVYACLISIFFLLLYIYTQSSSIYGGDAGDLVTAAYVGGVAHPPGYPLYTLFAGLLTKVPLWTVAWRVGLLSSIPAAISLAFIFLTIYKLSRELLASLIATFSLGLTYLMWLYAVVPEVFSLHLLLTVSIFYILTLFKDTSQIKWLYLAGFLFGLSISHHHMVVFLLPGFIILIWPRLTKIKITFQLTLRLVLAILLGLTPYLYVVLAASRTTSINWEDPQNVSGLVRLITRSMYGTFRTGVGSGANFVDRYFQLRILLLRFLDDFTRLGVFLIGVGATWHFLKHRREFWAVFLIVFLTGPFFVFYAGFPPVLDFYYGTVEKFLLVPFSFAAIWMALGIAFITRLLYANLHKLTALVRYGHVASLVALLPLSLLLINFQRISPLKNDRTAEKLAEDIVASVPNDSVLLLIDDTSTFNTLYLYYTQGGRTRFKNIKPLQIGFASFPFYQSVIAKHYPELAVGGLTDASAPARLLLKRATEQFPVFSTVKFGDDDEFEWLPWGVLYKLQMKSWPQKLSVEEILTTNEKLFANYQNPLSGALGIYRHAMLSDVLRVYADARREVGKLWLDQGNYVKAEEYFKVAQQLQSDFPDNQLLYGVALMKGGNCDAARVELEKIAANFSANPTSYYALMLLYRDCFKNTSQASIYEQMYKKTQKATQTMLR